MRHIFLASIKWGPSLTKFEVVKETKKMLMLGKATAIIGGRQWAKQVHKENDRYFDDPMEAVEYLIVEQAESIGETIVLSLMTPIMGQGGVTTVRSLLALNGKGEVQGTLKRTSKESSGGRISLGGDEGENWFRNWRLCADGRVYAAPYYEGYQVIVLGLDGAVERIVEMEYEHRKRSDEEIAEMEERNANMPVRGGARMQLDINPYSRDIDSFHPRADGELWVLSSKGISDCPEGSIGAFDVFDSRGRYRNRLTLDVDYDARYDDFRIEGDRLFVLKEANAGPGLPAPAP